MIAITKAISKPALNLNTCSFHGSLLGSFDVHALFQVCIASLGNILKAKRREEKRETRTPLAPMRSLWLHQLCVSIHRERAYSALNAYQHEMKDLPSPVKSPASKHILEEVHCSFVSPARWFKTATFEGSFGAISAEFGCSRTTKIVRLFRT